MMIRYHVPAVAFLILCSAGCYKSPSNGTARIQKLPLAGVKLKLAVADDPGLAAAVIRLQGEWNRQTGGEYEVAKIAANDLAKAKTLPADAVICPPGLLGPLAEQKLIGAVPDSLQKSPQWADVFDLLRHQEVGWGNEIMAVPFGSPVLVIYYRADLLEKLNRKPPQTWAEYQELAELFAQQNDSPAERPFFGTAEPLGPGWAGLVLLARAAPNAKHRDNYSTLFNIDTMAPLVAGPPMVRALEELAAAAKIAPPEVLQSDPTAIRDAFWQGKCAMALSWPCAADQHAGEKSATGKGPRTEVGFVELPGSTKVFNIHNQTWETRTENEDPHVPFLSIAGRVGVVSMASTQQEAAFQLLLWLSSEQNSPQVCPFSSATTLFRHSQLKEPNLWVEKPVGPEAAVKYAELAAQTFRREQAMDLRIPGREAYLAALDLAVHAAVRGELSAPDALAKAAKAWQEITEKLGVQQQRIAYLHSLGLQ
jgi:multiple sugar transport system substrate-binding protein